MSDKQGLQTTHADMDTKIDKLADDNINMEQFLAFIITKRYDQALELADRCTQLSTYNW